jgi:branched-chain amino acid transport system substrate-binding protein
MTFTKRLTTFSAALLGLLAPFAAQAADNVVIGDIDDMSGVYADVNGPRAVEGIKMASPTSAAACSASRSNS